jgi:hypothetical protein
MRLRSMLCLLILGSAAVAANAAKDETELVSRQSAADGGAGGDRESDNPAISADGRYIAFASRADNLSAVDIALQYDVFVRDMQTDKRSWQVDRASPRAGPQPTG